MLALLLHSFAWTQTVAPPPAAEGGAVSALGAAGSGIAGDMAKLKASAAAPRELFKLIENPKGRLVEVRKDQLGKLFLFSGTLEKGTGEKFLWSSLPADTFLFSFRQAGDKLQFMRKNTDHRAAPGTPEAKMVERSFQDSIVSIVAIASVTDQGNILFKAEDLFLDDLSDIGTQIRKTYPMKSPDMHIQLAGPAGTLEGIYSYPKNTEVQVQLVFVRGEGGDSQTMPDARMISVTMHYSLSALPEDGFESRPADERVGHFNTSYNDYSRADLKGRSNPAVNLVNHWRLEKMDDALPVSEVKNPIVIWLDDAMPHEYRPAVRAGLLAWNEAFEAVGFKNAVVVKEVDKDMPKEERDRFSPADASYNMVRWFVAPDAGMALGPSRANPLTGEIFQAGIHYSDLMTRWMSGEMDLAALEKAAEGEKGHTHDSRCSHHGAAAVRDAARNLAALQAVRPLSPEEKKAYVDQFLIETTAHEAGHILGLRHNFKGSTLLPYGQVGPDGLNSSSVMDYLPANLTGKGDYFQTKIGVYDKWAIEYAYKPLGGDSFQKAAELKAVADRSARDSRLAYGTDEDADSIDPDIRRFDMGKGGPLPFARHRAELAKKMWKSLETRQPRPEEGYESLREGFMAGFGQLDQSVRAVTPLIGGVRTFRVRPGDGKAPFEPVTGKEQREALSLLDQTIFAVDSFQSISPDLLRKLGGDHLERPVRPFPLRGVVQGLQAQTLDRLYSNWTFHRMGESALMQDKPGEALGVREMMTSVRASVWKELGAKTPGSIHPFRRDLQGAHVDALVRVMSDENAPNDARAAARQDLRALKGSLAAFAPKASGDTKAHVADMFRRVTDALEGKGGTVGRSAVGR